MKKWSTIQAFQFDDVVIEEWFDYGGKPHRSHLESLQAYLTTKTNVPVVAIGGISGEITTIYPKQ